MKKDKSGIAIIGMACRFPGAPDLAHYRANLEAGTDCITEAPPGRLDPSYYDPASNASDRIYCRRGGFIGEALDFDPAPFGIMPIAAKGAEPDFMLGLELVSAALKDAGLDRDHLLPREATSVIFGRGGYLGIRGIRVCEEVVFAQQIIESVKALIPNLTAEQAGQLKEAFTTQLGHYGPDTAIGVVPNIAASIIANRFGFGGSAYTVDAACASSLVAVDHAIYELQSGRSDLVITGGMHLCYDLIFWNIFSRLGAMSRSQQIRPFDRRADGLLIGEGIGVLVLARQEDAERRGDRIYALIRGSGISSDGRGKTLMLPHSPGQLLALERAWRSSGLDPSSLGLLEGHGTGTPEGDNTELETIGRFFGQNFTSSPVIGTVKSMIGHTMPAAGSAGLIKAALALHHGFLPPSLHCEEPSEALKKTGFKVLGHNEPWPRELARIAAVNAFGFGGINAHTVLEGVSQGTRRARSAKKPAEEEMLLLSAQDPVAMQRILSSAHPTSKSGPCRLAVENPTPERLVLAAKVVARAKPWHGRNGIWFTPRGLAAEGGKIAFIYPGLAGPFNPQVQKLAEFLGEAPPSSDGAGDDLTAIGISMVSLGLWMTEILERLGLKPDTLAGHSLGEWTGMVVSGIVDRGETARFIAEVAPALQIQIPGVVLASAGCGFPMASKAIEGLRDISVSHDNCPHQSVLCGEESSIDTALERLREAKVLCAKLDFRTGFFHSPLLEPYLARNAEHFRTFSFSPQRIPLWSATTLEPYPAEQEALHRLFVDHLLRPVRFRELIDRLYNHGHRVFIQVGMGRVQGFVEDTLSGKAHLAVSALSEGQDGLHQIRRLAASLWCEGYPVKLEAIGLRELLHRQDERKHAGKPLSLPLGLAPPVLSPTPGAAMAVQSGAAPKNTDLPAAFGDLTLEDPIMRELASLNQGVAAMAQEVVQAWQRHRQEGKGAARSQAGTLEARTLTRTTRYSLEAFPEVIDHCFMRQPPGWPNVADRFPVVPLCLSLQTLMDLARELVPERIPIQLEKIRASRWLEIAPPVDVEIQAEFDGQDRIRVRIGNYLQGTVVLGERYPESPPATPLEMGTGPEPCITAQQFYEDGWGFHGPAYQGVKAFSLMTSKGLSGRLESLPARGALLDAATQIAGFWFILHATENRQLLPYRIDRIRFFGPHPQPGTWHDCTSHVIEMTDVWARSNVEIYSNGKVWARIEGLEDRRFESDDRFYHMWRKTGSLLGADVDADGISTVFESWRTAASRYFIARGYLDSEEQAEYHRRKGIAQRAWLLGRVAAKDVARAMLMDKGMENIYPIQIRIDNDASGRPIIQGPWEADYRISLAHKEAMAVAIIAEGEDIGIDLEQISHHDEAFVSTAFLEEELALLPPRDRDEWLTRLWVAKEAYAKALGQRISNPRAIRAVNREAMHFFIGDTRVTTRREGDFIIGWTESANIWRPGRREAGD